MKKWDTPKATMERFDANEYVAACWFVKCDQVGTDEVCPQGAYGANDLKHRAEYCGAADHYQIKLDENGTPVSMTEVQTDKLGDLPCTLTNPTNIADVKVGMYIYWTTNFVSAKGPRTWHHHGTVEAGSNHS